jgi:predicted nucleic-acid-binding protein
VKTYIIDTNALLSFVTDRNPVQQEKAAELFKQAARMKCRIRCHQHVLTEFVYVLDKVYNHAKSSINQMIKNFISMPGIKIDHEIDFKALLGYWPDSISDFGDAVVATQWKMNRQASVVTFDKQFIKELKNISAKVHPT